MHMAISRWLQLLFFFFLCIKLHREWFRRSINDFASFKTTRRRAPWFLFSSMQKLVVWTFYWTNQLYVIIAAHAKKKREAQSCAQQKVKRRRFVCASVVKGRYSLPLFFFLLYVCCLRETRRCCISPFWTCHRQQQSSALHQCFFQCVINTFYPLTFFIRILVNSFKQIIIQ